MGDYGSFQQSGSFEREGNIFDLAAMLGINTASFNPVEHEICHTDGRMVESGCVKAVAYDWGSYHLVELRNPAGLSIPDDRHIVSLLKRLSTYLPDKALVTTVIRGSECQSKEGHHDTVAVSQWLQCTGDGKFYLDSDELCDITGVPF